MAFNYHKHRHFPKLSTTVILLSFLMPFFVVKCGDQTVDTLSGVELMTGKEDVGRDFNSSNTMTLKPRVFAVFAFICAAAATIFAWVRLDQEMLIGLILSGLGFVSLILLFWDIKATDLRSEGNDYNGMIKITLGFGYFFCQIMYILNILFYGFGYKRELRQFKKDNDNTVDRFT